MTLASAYVGSCLEGAPRHPLVTITTIARHNCLSGCARWRWCAPGRSHPYRCSAERPYPLQQLLVEAVLQSCAATSRAAHEDHHMYLESMRILQRNHASDSCTCFISHLLKFTHRPRVQVYHCLLALLGRREQHSYLIAGA